MLEYCYVCYVEHFQSDFIKLSCGCRFCREVIKNWVISQLNKYFVEDFMILCPRGDRGHYLTEEDIKKCLSHEEFENYQFILLKRSLIHDEEFKYCPQKSCNYIGWVDIKIRCTGMLECPNCNIKWKDPTLKPVLIRVWDNMIALGTGNIETFSHL